jgi:hypothetical protein
MYAVLREAVRQTVRRGGDCVDDAAVLQVIAWVERSMRRVGWEFRPELVTSNRTGRHLREAGFDYSPEVTPMATHQPTSAQAGEWEPEKGDPPFAQSIADAAEVASREAVAQGFRWPGTSHLLAAVLTRRPSTTAEILN